MCVYLKIFLIMSHCYLYETNESIQVLKLSVIQVLLIH